MKLIVAVILVTAVAGYGGGGGGGGGAGCSHGCPGGNNCFPDSNFIFNQIYYSCI